ncbi:MAG: hypothetical protein K8T26_08310 [Lentisphaerae bacterium]|nr:hypothetical protein [Lentisphaerota bacterium]
MKKSASVCALVALTALLGGGAALAAQPSGSTLLVIPARYTVVQFAFDVATIRSLYLVSYDRPATSTETRLYAWDNGKAEWLQIEESDIRSGSLFHMKPARTVLVGGEETLPASLADAATGGGPAKRITSLNLADIANSLNTELHFRSREWKWLADRYGFELNDQNAEQRRWGRYGPPGQSSGREARERSAPMPKAKASDVDVLPPVAMPQAGVAPVESTRQTIVIPVSAASETVSVPAIEEAAVPAPVAVVPAKAVDPLPENK